MMAPSTSLIGGGAGRTNGKRGTRAHSFEGTFLSPSLTQIAQLSKSEIPSMPIENIPTTASPSSVNMLGSLVPAMARIHVSEEEREHHGGDDRPGDCDGGGSVGDVG